ncbi:hypothetical protein EKO27_g10910 [Xylaria grammica]|uniref:Rho-GAP domain-containing protein n=1 Tax=Xylaria grammica TaxID=363999 RepID=A0A439CPX5_9PEZI|nr:hypothetical protein EKO27_g10910 [Xylaria grammica]
MDASETTKPKPTTTAASTANKLPSRADESPRAPNPRVGLGPGPTMSSISSPLAARAGHELPFVQPSSYLRPSSRSHTILPAAPPMSPIDEEQMQGLSLGFGFGACFFVLLANLAGSSTPRTIVVGKETRKSLLLGSSALQGLRDFLRVRTSYDVLPLSFRLIILDNDLLIKKSLNILIQNGIVSAPLWDSHNSKFAGILTATDYINLIQYYCQFPEHIDNVDKFRLSSLREIEKAIGVFPIETVSVHPSQPLYEACSRMLSTRARRIPLVDIDDETGRETVVSVITQYRILKFIAVNTEQYTSLLKKTVREIGLGTYTNLRTGTMTQSVLEIINEMVTNNISAVPIVDKNNVVLNVFEAIDVIPIIKTGVVEELQINVGEALSKRADEFGGIFTCQEDDRLDSIFITLRTRGSLVSEVGKGRGIGMVYGVHKMDQFCAVEGSIYQWSLLEVRVPPFLQRASMLTELIMLHSGRLSRAIIAGSCRQNAGHEDGKDAANVKGRSSRLDEQESRSRPGRGRFRPIHLVIHQPSNIDWDSRYAVDPMPPHHSRRDRSVVPTEEKGKEPAVRTWPTPSNPHIVSPGKSVRRPSLSQSLFAQPRASSNPPLIEGNLRSEKHSSNTWTSSSENPELGSDGNGKDNREKFVSEYNRLAQQHGLRPLVPEDFSPTTGRASDSLEGRRGSWFSKMLRQASEQPEQATIEPDKTFLRHQRGHSDAPLSLVHNHKRDGLKDQDLKALVRLCGKSPLFLPMDYAPFSLSLPTCFRALAQALVQHADTKGIFRVPGSERVINALYEYYCTDGDTDAISSTTRCPTLPTHIRFNTHDIASTFKRILAGLPGGILGSLSLFDALVAIHSQLQGGAELLRTKESKLRARLIALAIGTVKSQYQRELICAVFGLLCLVGRIAENAPREDESGRPLPTTDLMGYNALSIVFGPLLIGDLIDNYSMKLADPSAGLVLLPISPPISRKERHRHKHQHRHRPRNKHGKNHAPSTDPSLSVDKIHIANSITEMLIIHWREVVRQIRSTGSVKNRRNASNSLQYPENVAGNVSSSVSENSLPRNPSYLDHAAPRRASPSTVSPAATLRTKLSSTTSQQGTALDPWTPRAVKASISSSGSIQESPLHIDELKPASGSEKTSNSFVSDVTQNAYSMSSDAHAGRTHESSSAASVNRPEMMNNESIVGTGITIPRTVPALGTRKTETPRSSLSLEPQNRTPNMSRLDTAPLDSSEAEDVSPSPGARVNSSLGSPIAQMVSHHEHTQANPNLKAHYQITLRNSRAEASPIDSEYVVDMKKMGSRKIQTDRKTDTPVKVPSLGRIRLPYSHNDDRGNGYLPKSNTEPNLHRRGKPMSIQLTDPGHEPSETLVKPNPSSGTLGTPVDQWRNLKASSKASTESLAKSAKERRLKRSSGHTPSRASRDVSILADPRPMTPEWKRQLTRERGKPREKSTTTTRREKESILGDTPPLTPLKLAPRVKHASSGKYSTDTPHRWASQRSPSKPLPGAVKAMAALFDNAAKESPDNSAAGRSGRARNSPRESNDCPCRDTVGESPTKSNPPRGALASMNSSVNLDEQPNQRKPAEALAPGASSADAGGYAYEVPARHVAARSDVFVVQKRAAGIAEQTSL